LKFGAWIRLNADAAFPCRTCRTNWACQCRKSARPGPQWRQPWRRRRWKISSTISSNHSADISCLPSCWSEPGFRCRFRTFHNEIRKSAWGESIGTPVSAQLSFAPRAALIQNWVTDVLTAPAGGKHPTFNIEHPTSNNRPSAALWRFDVGRWMLDVPSDSLGGTGGDFSGTKFVL
jgi:hypothetical protein